MSKLKSQEGVALVLTLMILAIITAVVVEFAYGVYTTTSALYNWKDSQRLSFVAKSGVSVALRLISTSPKEELYKYIGKDIPLEKVSEGFSGRLIIRGEDENGKFNLNSLVGQTGEAQPAAIRMFGILLKNLGLDDGIADRVADWIHRGSVHQLPDYGDSPKNGYLDSVDELLLIKGIDQETYGKLLPYVTVYSYDSTPFSAMININTASLPVIMSLSESVMKEDAERIISARQIKPFAGTDDPAFSSAVGSLKNIFMGKIDTNIKNLRIISVGEEDKIRRVIECVIDVDVGSRVKYWRET